MRLRARALWVEKYRSIVDNDRGHSIVLDIPFEYDGDDTGPTSLELAVMGLAGCVVTIYSIIARKRKFSFSGMRVEVDAEKPEGAPTVAKVEGKVEIEAEDEEEAKTVYDLTMKNCPVGVLFDRPDIKVTWHLTIKKPQSTK